MNEPDQQGLPDLESKLAVISDCDTRLPRNLAHRHSLLMHFLKHVPFLRSQQIRTPCPPPKEAQVVNIHRHVSIVAIDSCSYSFLPAHRRIFLALSRESRETAFTTGSVIKIRMNSFTDYCHGSKRRRREVRVYNGIGYRKWAEQSGYGMRWPGTEGVFSGAKRKFGETLMATSRKRLVAEAIQIMWAYDFVKCYGEDRVTKQM